MNTKRVHYYSPNDLACSSNLELAEKVLSRFKEEKEYDINDIIELHQVKLYIDNEIYLNKWTEDDIKDIQEKGKKIWSVIVKFWQKINNDNFSDLINQLDCWTLQEYYWDITVRLSAYKNISKELFFNLLQSEKVYISDILHLEKLVKFYATEVRNYLLIYDKSAELLLTQYVEKHDRDRRDYYFPKSLSLKDKEEIILRYLDNKDANLNFVRLVLNVQKSGNLDISDKTRLKAKRLEEKLNNDILEKNGGVLFGIQVGFSKDQKEPLKVTKDGNTDIFTYSTQYILKRNMPIPYLAHFERLFIYLDRQRCISMVSKDSEFGTFEKIIMKSKNEYLVGPVFNKKETLSLAQIFLYNKILCQNQKQNVEEIIHYYIVDHLNTFFGLKNFRFHLPSNGTSYSERIRTLLAEYDALLRQYKLYKENGEIDNELFCMSSSAYNLSQIPSFVTKKYCYLNKDKLTFPINLLFSDQPGLSYVEPFKEKNYHCLYDLIVKEEVLYGNFESYQSDRLYHLFKLEYLFVDHNGYLRIKDENQIFILKTLYKEEVLNYWHYPEECKIIIDQMVNDDILYFEDTLFNKLEQSYFNYFLNKKEFTNGLDLRNSFMHGTNPDSENELINLYYVLLRIIVLTVLKIDDDQTLKQKIEKNI